jgi:DNA-damage-inducible protein D
MQPKKSCETNGNAIEHHFTPSGKTIDLPKGAKREINDYLLSKYACHLIAMNGDVRKPEIAAAQAYFVVATQENEMHKLRLEQEERLKNRREVAQGNKSLFEAAILSGVQRSRLGVFEDSGIWDSIQ